MPSPYTVTFPVKPYIRKYLIYVSDNKAEPVIFKKNDHHYNKLLSLLISRRTLEMAKYEQFTQGYEDDTSNVTIQLRWTGQYQGRPNITSRTYLSRRRVELFNNYAVKWFKLMGSDFILDRILKGYTRWDAIYMLMDELTITEDEVKAESLYRFFTRLKEEMC